MKIHPLCAVFPKMEDEAFESLVASIKANGQRSPIVLHDGMLLDGRHRLRACERLGIEPRTVEFGGGDPLAFVIDKNVERRHLTESQRAMVAAKLATASAGARKGDSHWKHNSANLQSNEVTEAEAAGKLRVSTRSVSSASKVIEEAAPDVVDAVMSGDVSVSDAARVADAPHDEQVEALARVRDGRVATITSGLHVMRNEGLSEDTMPELPVGEYRVVVADPPWPMEFSPSPHNRLQSAGEPPYPVMPLDEIKALSLPLADDAWVFLWTIQQYLRDAFDVLDAWGSPHRFTMAWIKTHGPKPIGMPLSNMEIVLVGRRGKPKFRDTKQFQMAFHAPRGEHSQKPAEFYDLLNRVTVGPRLDMFSRRAIEGFDAWGKEAKS